MDNDTGIVNFLFIRLMNNSIGNRNSLCSISAEYSNQLQKDILKVIEALNERSFMRSPYVNENVKKYLNDIIINESQNLKKHVRVKRITFLAIANVVQNETKGWSVEIELLVLLLWLAAGASYRTTSLMTHIPKATVCDIVHRLLNAFALKIGHFIKLPNENNQYEFIGNGFAALCRFGEFNKVLGAIDVLTLPMIIKKIYITALPKLQKCAYI